MVGSAKNRKNLAAAIRARGFYARDLTTAVELGRLAKDQCNLNIIMQNGRRVPYLSIPGNSEASEHITGNCQQTADKVVEILEELGMPRLDNS